MATPSSTPATGTLTRTIRACIRALEHDPNLVRRARVAHKLTELARTAVGQFSEQRALAFSELRAEGWSLTDLAAEFGIERQRASQLINRENG